MTPNIKEICQKLDLEKLEKLAIKLENEIREYLQQKIPVKTGFDIVIGLVKRSEELTLTIDIRIEEGVANIFDHNKIINDAINYARKRFEHGLKEIVAE
ncbi:MAG: hypothetical protein QXP02_00270 [Desulfurococcaceae archaeon]